MTDRPTPTSAQTPASKQEIYAKIIHEQRRSKVPAPMQRLSPLAELVKTRLREFYREPAVVFWVFVFPLLMAIGLGVAFRSKEVPVPLVAVVAHKDAPATSEGILALLESSRVNARQLNEDEARALLKHGKVDLMVSLGKVVTFRFDPKKDSGPVAKMIANDILQERAGRKDPVDTEEDLVTEPGARYIDFLIPGLIGMNLMGSSMWGIGFNLVMARKRKLLRRYAVTPMKRPHFFLSYLISRSFFLVIELSVLIGFGILMFGTQIQGSYFAVIFIAALGASAYAGIGVLIGSRLDSTETANGWMNFVQLPMYVLSGAFFSYERFPQWMHTPIEMLPLTSIVNALRAIFNEGAGLASLGQEITVLGVWAAGTFFLAGKLFRWQ